MTWDRKGNINVSLCRSSLSLSLHLTFHMSDEVYLVLGQRTRILIAGPDLVPQEGLDSGLMSEVSGSRSSTR